MPLPFDDFLKEFVVALCFAERNRPFQGWAKTWVFHQKPSPAGLTGLNRVLMAFMGQTGEIENYASTECYFNSTIPYKQKLLNKEDSKPCENEKFQKNGVLGVIPESTICI